MLAFNTSQTQNSFWQSWNEQIEEIDVKYWIMVVMTFTKDYGSFWAARIRENSNVEENLYPKKKFQQQKWLNDNQGK